MSWRSGVGADVHCPRLPLRRRGWARRAATARWGYSIVHGATTIWKRWDGWTGEKGFQSTAMNSFNHYSLGSVGQWLFEGMAGITSVGAGAAFRTIRLRPMPGPGVDSCRARYRSPRGWIGSSWTMDERVTRFTFEVPANTRAEIELRMPRSATLRRDRAVIAPDRWDEGACGPRACINAGSGVYTFEVTT